ncbi:unnamed protein product, partial [Acanthoscelides obtectus]
VQNSSEKKKFSENYVKFRFTFIEKDELQLPQCVICMKVLSNDSLERHLKQEHPTLVLKMKEFFSSKAESLKRMRLDKSGSYHTEEILYSQSLTAGNTSEDIFNSISNFVEKNDLEWKKLIVVCTDGAPVMIGTLPSLALRILVPFSSTYLCETGFSALVLIKTKRRNRLDVDSVLMIALAKVEPRINQQNMQSQVPTLILFKLFDKKHLFVHLNF